MTLTVAAEPAPIRVEPDGTARIGGTRVTLDTIVAVYDGAPRRARSRIGSRRWASRTCTRCSATYCGIEARWARTSGSTILALEPCASERRRAYDSPGQWSARARARLATPEDGRLSNGKTSHDRRDRSCCGHAGTAHAPARRPPRGAAQPPRPRAREPAPAPPAGGRRPPEATPAAPGPGQAVRFRHIVTRLCSRTS
jgi:hypothetical protein